MPPNSARPSNGRIPTPRCSPRCRAPAASGSAIRSDSDFLVVRTGLHDAPLNAALRVKDSADEVDLEPVSHTTLRGLLDVQRTVRAVPAGIDLAKVSRITVLGEPDDVRGALRAWITQAVTWHDPAVLGVALASPDFESDDWSWLKWLPHNDIPGSVDGAGPARYLAGDVAQLRSMLDPALDDRASVRLRRRIPASSTC